MGRPLVLVACLTAAVAGVFLRAPARAQSSSPLAGVWTLNRSLSAVPRDIGFNMSWVPPSDGDGRGASGSAGRGRQGGSGGGNSRGATPARPESYEDARRVDLLTSEVRTPPSRLIIVVKPGAVTMTNELGQPRTFHPDGREESIAIQDVPVRMTSKLEGDRLVVLYHLDQDREIRYSYSPSSSSPSSVANPARIAVEVQFLEHGAGDKASLVYEPGVETETRASSSQGTQGAPPAAPASPAGPARPATPASPGKPATEAFDQRPGAEFKGLTSLGVVVEELSPQAAACGLNREAIDSALSKQLKDGGFVVRHNSDDDTYVDVSIITTSLSNGMCVSRYDAFLNTNATAKLSYHDQPVLVQASLIHRGGIAGSAAADHGAGVARGLQNFIELFITQIHDANK